MQNTSIIIINDNDTIDVRPGDVNNVYVGAALGQPLSRCMPFEVRT